MVVNFDKPQTEIRISSKKKYNYLKIFPKGSTYNEYLYKLKYDQNHQN